MVDFTGMLGSLVSGGLGLIGSKMSADASNKAARLNAIVTAQQNELSRQFADQQALRQMEFQAAQAGIDRDLQREFAQNGVSWKIADARAAGISPLVALGAQTHSPSPISVGGAAGSWSPNPIAPFAGASPGSGFAAFGQDLSRAINATRTEEDKAAAFTETSQKLQLQRAELENTLLASQIAKVNQAGSSPSMPSATGKRMIDGQGNTSPKALTRYQDLIKDKPLERTPSDPEKPGQEPGVITDRGFARGPKSWSTVMSKDVQERLEEDWWGTTAWNLRNRVPKVLQIWENKDAPFPAPAGKEWFTNAFGDFRLRNIRADGQGSRLFRRKPR